MNTLTPMLRARLAGRGISPDVVIPDEPPFDPTQWRRDNYRAWLEREIPARFAAAQPDHPLVRAWVRQQIDQPGVRPALLMGGNTGVGKTWQAYGALKALVMAAASENRRCRWQVVTHPDLNAQMRPQPDGSHTHALEKFLAADIVVLDDLGAGKQTDWTADSLVRLVDHRWSNALVTIYSTNLTPADLSASLGDRIVSRLADACRVALDGDDRRWLG